MPISACAGVGPKFDPVLETNKSAGPIITVMVTYIIITIRSLDRVDLNVASPSFPFSFGFSFCKCEWKSGERKERCCEDGGEGGGWW